MSIRTAQGEWKGNLKDGKGIVKLGSGSYEGPYSFASRFEEGSGTLAGPSDRRGSGIICRRSCRIDRVAGLDLESGLDRSGAVDPVSPRTADPGHGVDQPATVGNRGRAANRFS